MNLSLILPTYEEAGNIAALCRELQDQLNSCPGLTAHEIIIIDDSPNDETAQAANAYIETAPKHSVRLHHRKNGHGLASAIQCGIEMAQYDDLIFMDSDFNHHPRYIPIMVQSLSHFDLVIGSRYVKGGAMRGSRFRYFGSFLFNAFVRALLRTQVHDNLSGFIAIRRLLLTQMRFPQIFYGYGDYCIRLIHETRWLDCRMLEIPVIYEQRLAGISKTNLLRVLFKYSGAVFGLLLSAKPAKCHPKDETGVD